jgi:hypothetical protein
MGIERRTDTIPASGVISTPRGNYFLLLTANAAVNLRAEARGSSEGFNGVIGGILIRRRLPWDFIEIIGVNGTTLEYFVGHEEVTDDETDIRLAVSVIAGAVNVTELPATSLGNIAPVTALSGAETLLIPANAARKRVRIFCDSANVDGGAVATHCYFRGQAGGNNIGEAVPGIFHEFKNSSAVYARNDSGSSYVFYMTEET